MVSAPLPMSSETLAEVLSKLPPQPVEAYVAVNGGFDYSSLIEQVRGVSGIDIYVVDRPILTSGIDGREYLFDKFIFRLQSPSNEKILAIYRADEARLKEESARNMKETIAFVHGPVSSTEPYPPSVYFHKGIWHVPVDEILCKVEITPRSMKIKYNYRPPGIEVLVSKFYKMDITVSVKPQSE